MRQSLPDGPLTVEEFERLAEGEEEYFLELVRGRVVREPRPNPEHGRIVANLCYYLRRFAAANGLGTVFAESGFELPGYPATVRGPDVSFVSTGRLEAARPHRAFPRIAPDLAVEVVSPSNTAIELREKAAEYLVAGSRLVWVLYPKTRTAVVYREGGEAQLLRGDDRLEGGAVLPGFSIALSELFE
jgi:Uma2 family endonuclease